MNNLVPYKELKFLADFYQRTGIMPRVETFLELLAKYNISLRGRFGSVRDISISTPKNMIDAVALQIRYLDSAAAQDTLIVRS